MKPFVKWAGGKRQIVDDILKIIDVFATDDNNNNYTFYEPFVGGGAVFLNLSHNNVVINDTNKELMNAYNVIKNNPKELMEMLDYHKAQYLKNNEKHYYEIRKLDRNLKQFNALTNIEKAARTIFLNKTCYNGLYRVNLNGQFNTPMGRYKNPSMYERNNIIKLSKYFNNNNIKIMNDDYSSAIKHAKSRDIIYVDPPYDYGEDNDGFTKYQKDGFTFKDFITLKENLDKAIGRGAFVIISNNATDRVIELFETDPKYTIIYNLKILKTNRIINSKGSKRKTGREVLIMGSPITFPQANSVEKLMKLIRLRNPEIIKNTEELKRVLDVKSYRQIHYYTTALRYLGLTNSKNEYTTKAKELRKYNRVVFEKEFAELIISIKPFKDIFEYEIENNVTLINNEIVYFIKNYMEGYSYSTQLRRSSTVRKWVDWCKVKLS